LERSNSYIFPLEILNMNDYGEPKTFTLDYGQMNVLFELLEEAFKTDKDERLERLRWLRNQLYGYLS
jgi:hypothetical protein